MRSFDFWFWCWTKKIIRNSEFHLPLAFAISLWKSEQQLQVQKGVRCPDLIAIT